MGLPSKEKRESAKRFWFLRLKWLCNAALILAAGFGSNSSFAQSNLPPEVQADILKTRIYEALQKKDLSTVIASMDQYRQLKVVVPPALIFLDAKAAAASDEPLRAFASLEEFLKIASRDSPQYKEALALYTPYQIHAADARATQEAKVQAEQRKVEDDKRLAAEAKRIQEQARIDTARSAALQRAPAVLADIQKRMQTIPAGQFKMGSADPYGGGPVHLVTIQSFRLSAYEVTFDQYDTFAAATGRILPEDNGWGRGNRPVVNVSWDDAKAFLAWVNQQAAGKFRLPTEAEWEYAARAGTTTAYPWGASFSADQANGEGTSGRDKWDQTAPVGSFPANQWGLYDMIGNVWEWTEDCVHINYSGAPVDGSAWITGDSARRILRGGSYDDDGPTYLRVSNRTGGSTEERNDNGGFRLAQDP